MAGKKKRSWKRIVLWVVGILVVLFAVMQAVPYGRSHTNPPASNPFKWTNAQAEAIARNSCYDCHSNETKWWWATNIAPFSWLIQADVNGGRNRLNFSDYDGEPSVEELTRAVNGGMPPFQYTIVHRSAKLTAAQKQTLIDGYTTGQAATLGSSSGGSSSSATSTTSTSGTSTSSDQQGSTTTAAASTTSTGQTAEAIINQACVQCHGADDGLNFHTTDATRAQSLINDMIRRGAKLTAEQQKILLKYFTR